MNDYFDGKSRQELEALARRLIEQGSEGHKVDFKEGFNLDGKADKAEFAKDVSSIANTDDESHLDDFGFIIIGAKRNQLIGKVSELGGDIDKLQAHLTDILKNYVAPVPAFSVVAFNDPKLGPWGLVLISPSVEQPHILFRDGVGVVKNEWCVRINDTTERAGALDYARVMAKRVRREVRPLELEVQRLAMLVEQRLDTPDLSNLVAAIRAGTPTPSTASDEGDVAARVRRLLVSGTTRVEEQLVAEALRVAEIITTASDENPWLLPGTPEQLRNVLTYLEDRTFPLAEALANVGRYDKKGELYPAVWRAISIIAREPQPTGAHYRHISQFRLYPLILCIYAIVIVGVAEQRQDLVEGLFKLSLVHADDRSTDPLVAAVRRHRFAEGVFKTALERDYFEPIAVRIKEVLLPRLAPLLAGTELTDAFFVAEFVVGLAYLNISAEYHTQKIPLPGCYFYDWDARRAIPGFLKKHPLWLGEAIGVPLDVLLADFDKSAKLVVDHRSFHADGFISGAVEAFGSDAAARGS